MLIKEINKLKPSKRPKRKKTKKIVTSLLLKQKRSIKFKPRKKSKKDVYKPIKISGAFINDYVEYKSNSKKDKSISIASYLNKIREYLRKMIDDKKRIGEWKIQLVLKINFTSSKNFSDVRDMHNKSDNVEIMMGFDTNEIIKKLFNSLLQRYQKGLEESMKESDFVFDYVESLNYIFHKIDLKRFRSYIETPEWIKNKKGTINCHNYDDDKCFQYSITNALNYDKIKKKSSRFKQTKKIR